jgi:hypothetical protein
MSRLRVWIYLLVVMALMLTIELLAVVGTPSPVQADGNPVVIFPDPNLETAIREAIDKPIGDIYQSELEDLTEFSAEKKGIVNITGLQHCTNLRSLDLSWNHIISDISPLAGLTSLIELNLWLNQISDISPLASLTSLIELNLGSNEIGDISLLASFINLTLLDLGYNQIGDISPLANLTSLTSLSLSDNQISDISPLANLTSLTELDLGANPISDISPLASLTSLIELNLESNNISDIKPLVDNPGLGDGDHVVLRFNPLSHTSLNTYIPQLEARGVSVDYRDVSMCFFTAIAAYGTSMAGEIEILRQFRNEYLLTNPLGQALVGLYYRFSPPMAEFITGHPSLKPIARVGLLPAVAISTLAVNTGPAEKAATVGLLALVSVVLAVWAARRRSRCPQYARG